MRRRAVEAAAPFQSIGATSRATGLSQDFIRRGVRAGTIPAIRAGSGSNAPWMIDVEAFLAQLHAEAAGGGAGP